MNTSDMRRRCARAAAGMVAAAAVVAGGIAFAGPAEAAPNWHTKTFRYKDWCEVGRADYLRKGAHVTPRCERSNGKYYFRYYFKKAG